MGPIVMSKAPPVSSCSCAQYCRSAKKSGDVGMGCAANVPIQTAGLARLATGAEHRFDAVRFLERLARRVDVRGIRSPEG